MNECEIPNYVAYSDHLYWEPFCISILTVDIGNDACVFSKVLVNFCLHILIIFGNIFNVFASI